MLTPQDVHITFFDIKKCGFYKLRENDSLFGGVDDILTQLQAWSAGAELSRTKLFDPGEDSDDDPVYLFGLKKGAAGWLVATWNEVHHTESGVASVSMNSKVGEEKVHMNGVVENSIPGYATYFWIIPDRNLLATVRFSNKSGQQGLADYLERFMERYSRYAVIAARDGKDVAIGYTNLRDAIPIQNVKPRFKTLLHHKPGTVEFFIDRVAQIKRVVRRAHLTTNTVLQTTIWQNMIKLIHGEANRANVTDQRVYVEVDYQPTVVELAQMIDAENALQHRGHDDLGFVFDGESKPHWLSGTRASGVISLNVERINEAAVSMDSLLQALQDNRNDILQFLR